MCVCEGMSDARRKPEVDMTGEVRLDTAGPQNTRGTRTFAEFLVDFKARGNLRNTRELLVFGRQGV